ncbi:hypothetical protein LTAR_01823 [Leptolinea tardivitalis]|nr:hypothetical protein LTAR_01823 [Leptolinea tardivitalis]
MGTYCAAFFVIKKGKVVITFEDGLRPFGISCITI